MKAEQICKAWNAQADDNNQWHELDSVEKVDFALKYIDDSARDALDELWEAVYSPDASAISVDHAINHVRQVFSD